MDETTLRSETRRITRGVLFDLDGTLADTAPDLADALNRLLVEQGRNPLPFDDIRCHVSRGGAALVRLGFGTDTAPGDFETLRARLLELYDRRLCVRTRLFPGMGDVLGTIERAGIRWGVVTNKPARFTEPLMDRLELAHRATCVVSGDTVDQRKPHPKPLLHACGVMDVAPGSCVYVGDDPRDVQAGNSAGMQTLVAGYGYIPPDSDPTTWGADGRIGHASDLLSWLLPGQGNRTGP